MKAVTVSGLYNCQVCGEEKCAEPGICEDCLTPPNETALDIVLASYRDIFGVKTERGNELHRDACIEVWRLREKADKVYDWIPVGESIPQNGVKVLVHIDNLNMNTPPIAVAWFDRGLWWVSSTHALDRTHQPVDYWMSLPDMPK